MKSVCIWLVVFLFVCAAFASPDENPLPSFQATSLSGESVTDRSLVGKPAVLIVTPSRGAADDTRMWVKALRNKIDLNSIKVRDILCIDLPFFISESDAINRAKEKIPARFYDQTWLLAETILETSLGIPRDSNKAFVLVLDSKANITTRVEGEPNQQRIAEIEAAIQDVTNKIGEHSQ